MTQPEAFEILMRALRSDFGLILASSEPHRARQRLYSARLKARDELGPTDPLLVSDLMQLEIRSIPTELNESCGGDLAILKNSRHELTLEELDL